MCTEFVSTSSVTTEAWIECTDYGHRINSIATHGNLSARKETVQRKETVSALESMTCRLSHHRSQHLLLTMRSELYTGYLT